MIADGNCNSKELKIILEASMVAGDANASKRNVHTTANEQFHNADNQKGIDVICAPSKISYRIATDLFCEVIFRKLKSLIYPHFSSPKKTSLALPTSKPNLKHVLNRIIGLWNKNF